jgi:osmoprotectant transport system ATP-binding protein
MDIECERETDLGEYPDRHCGSPVRARMSELALAASAVEHRFGSTRALRGVDLHVAVGECVALVGESGSGKTTLLRCFNALVRPTAGSVRTLGRDVREQEPEVLRRNVGYVPQDGGLLPHWTVLRNAALVPRLLGRADAETRAREGLARVGLDPDRFGARWPRELSGGQRQRVALARALAAAPAVVLLDEPFGALDALTRSDVQELFIELRRDRAFSALLVTHDLREAFRLADRVAVLREGEILQADTPAALRAAPREGYVEALLRRAGVVES